MARQDGEMNEQLSEFPQKKTRYYRPFSLQLPVKVVPALTIFEIFVMRLNQKTSNNYVVETISVNSIYDPSKTYVTSSDMGYSNSAGAPYRCHRI